MDGSDGSTVPLWIAFSFLILAGAYFASAESSFSAVSKIKIKAKAEEGNQRAKGVMYILNRFEKALTTLLVGNNITHIAAASVATVIAARIFETRGVNVDSFGFSMTCTVVITAVIFLFSEMIPKSLANDRSETVSLASAGSLRIFMKIFWPISSFLGLISGLFSRLFGKESTPSITEDELTEIFDTAEEEGVVDEEQGDMLKSVLEFDDTVVRDVMTMEKDVESLNVAANTAEILSAIRRTNHSRLPVYSGTPDHVIGTVRIRSFLTEYRKNPEVKLRSVLSAPYFVRETAKIDDVLTDMRQHKHHMAVVIDKDRHAVGLVTIEDFLEELVGEIFDEEDVVDRNFQALGGNKYLVNTRLTMGKIYQRMGLTASREIAPKPLLSLLIEQFGHVPLQDEETVFNKNLEITVHTCEGGVPTQAVIHIMDEDDLRKRNVTSDEEVRA